MTDDVIGLEASAVKCSQHCEARGDERRLLDPGVNEILERRLEAEPLQIEARGLAAILEHLHRLRHRLGDLPAHARLQRPLPREAERDLGHPCPPFPFAVHSIKAEPQVSPAPIPVIRTISPALSRPSSSASPSASGIEPEE